jgi:hypothetical protein
MPARRHCACAWTNPASGMADATNSPTAARARHGLENSAAVGEFRFKPSDFVVGSVDDAAQGAGFDRTRCHRRNRAGAADRADRAVRRPRYPMLSSRRRCAAAAGTAQSIGRARIAAPFVSSPAARSAPVAVNRLQVFAVAGPPHRVNDVGGRIGVGRIELSVSGDVGRRIYSPLLSPFGSSSCVGRQTKCQVRRLALLGNESCCQYYCGRSADGCPYRPPRGQAHWDEGIGEIVSSWVPLAAVSPAAVDLVVLTD